jgi:putative flippase GtrA
MNRAIPNVFFNKSFNGPEVLRYLVTGSLNAVLTCTIYAAGLYLFELHYLLALIVAFLVGNVFNYFFHFVWVFRPEETFTFRSRYVKYLTSNMGTFGFNLLALYYAVDGMGGDPLLWQAILMVLIIVANFLFAKHWSLRRQ